MSLSFKLIRCRQSIQIFCRTTGAILANPPLPVKPGSTTGLVSAGRLNSSPVNEPGGVARGIDQADPVLEAAVFDGGDGLVALLLPPIPVAARSAFVVEGIGLFRIHTHRTSSDQGSERRTDGSFGD